MTKEWLEPILIPFSLLIQALISTSLICCVGFFFPRQFQVSLLCKTALGAYCQVLEVGMLAVLYWQQYAKEEKLQHHVMLFRTMAERNDAKIQTCFFHFLLVILKMVLL